MNDSSLPSGSPERETADYHLRYGLSLYGLGRHSEAIESYDRALAACPQLVDALIGRGNALIMIARFDEALASFDRALAIDAGALLAHDNRGVALSRLHRAAEALTSHDRAIALKPAFATAYINRGNALFDLGRLSEALDSYDNALRLASESSVAWRSRGTVLRELKRLPEALASYRQSRALNPEDTISEWHEAITLLLSGDLEKGWPAFEARWNFYTGIKPEFACPRWQGEDLRGKTILLWAEAGYGDTLQFCRYVPLVAERGGRVVFSVQQPLKRLLGNLAGVSEIYAENEALPATDYHCPLLSLPALHGTTLENIPREVPYVRPQLTEKWKAFFQDLRPPVIGLCWFSNRGPIKEKHRSIALDALDPILSTGASFVALQKDVPTQWDQRLGWQPIIEDFADTAALIAHVDLVISVDTSVAHLAGAMGKPVWILIPYIGTCWRWLTERSDSPWYPTARLFRQQVVGDWESLTREVASHLVAATTECR
jgi:Flp pilus assembly protein TadD